jgi:serine/threonine protein kinase/tetratricopeptide (TPR) repeat protein
MSTSSNRLEAHVSTEAAPAAGNPEVVTQTIHVSGVAPGASIGPYVLIRQIGEGGMGSVYHAQQRETIRRDVALKIIKPGMDSQQVISRFESERQALAVMNHPNVAQVLDAGTTAAGLPYFVMELVDGVPITVYCDSKGLDVRQRIKLFIPVCQAIQHAHQKGIIHRDIKPSNILVAEREGQPAPKVIDFGLAKALGAQLSDATMLTTAGTVVGTLNYMSPEQAELTRQDVDTRSDVYSLGAVLYELLIGATPLERERSQGAGYIELLQAVRTQETVAPSKRLRRSPSSAAVAASRQSDAARLPKQLDGELDWIVMKALEKDRTRRYETVDALRRDLERFLAGEPVEAAPPSAAYRIGKFVRKHRTMLATAAAFAALLIAGVVISTIEARRAEQRFAQVRQLANTFLFQFHDEIRDIPGTTKARAMVVKTALQYLDSLSHNGSKDPALTAELAQAYRRVADAQGSPNSPNLGDSKGALASLERAVSLYKSITPRDRKYLRQEVDCLRIGAIILANEQKGSEAGRWMEQATAAARPFESDPDALGLITNLYSSAGDVQMIIGTGETAEPFYRKAVGFVETWARSITGQTEAAKAYQMGIMHLRLARSLMGAGRLKEAAAEFEISAADNQRALDADPRKTGYLLTQTSILLSLMELYGGVTSASLEDPQRTLRYARAAEVVLRNRTEVDVDDFNARVGLVGVSERRASALFQKKQDGAMEEARKAVSLWRELRATGRLTATDAFSIALEMNSLVPVVGSRDRREAAALAREALGELRRVLGTIPPEDDNNLYVALGLSVVGNAQRAAGNRTESQRSFEEALAVGKPVMHIPALSILAAYTTAQIAHLARIDRFDRGNCAEARDWWQKEVEVWRTLAAKNEYAAMRLDRAQSDVPPCSGKQ